MFKQHKRLAAWVGLVILTVVPPTLLSQTSPQGNSAHQPKRVRRYPLSWDEAANRWQLAPIDSQTQVDTVSSDVRQQRNAFWTEPVRNMFLRTGPGLGSPGLIDEQTPEIDEPGGIPSVWVVARFEAFHVYAVDPQEDLLYTEINVRVDRVIKAPADLSIARGALLDVAMPGGTLRMATGKTITSPFVIPSQYGPKPGHAYILQLLYNAKFGVFTDYRRWEVSSGVVQPDDVVAALRAAHGKSKLTGLSLGAAVEYLQSALPTETKDR